MKRQRREGPSPSMFDRVFGLDLRSLAAFRVGVSLFILYDLISRGLDLTAHYTDAGTMPRIFVERFYALNPAYSSWSPTWLSIHMATGSALGTGAIFAVNALVALALLAGYRTRLMTFLAWYLMASLQTRNPLVVNGGDSVALNFLFFGMFLPLGARYSIDEALNTGKRLTPNLYAGAATLAVYVQFICIFFFTALLKSGPEWRTDGTAVYYALNIDQYVLPAGKLLLQFPALMKALTFAVWWLELLGSFIFLVPSPLAKLAGVIAFGCLYAGFAATLAIGHFPWVNVIALSLLLPSPVWDFAYRWLEKKRPAIEIVYDGDCGFCKKMVAMLAELACPRLLQAPHPAQGKDLATMRRENSWIVRTSDGAESYRFEAIIRLASSSLLFRPASLLLRVPPIPWLGDVAYRFVANHRNLMAKFLAPFSFRAISWRSPWWREAIVVFFVAGILVSNAAPFVSIPLLHDIFNVPVLVVRMEQYWGMFAPAPNKDAPGWFVIEGWLSDGSTADAFRRRTPVRFDQPQSISEYYPSERWRRYMMHVAEEDFKDFRLPLAHYLCEEWNADHSGSAHMDRLSIYFMRERTPPPGQPRKLEKLHFYDFPCSRQ